MKISDKEKEILEKYFNYSEDENYYMLENWTNGGVDMMIYIDKNKKNIVEALEGYVEYFDIDEEIDTYRQDESYKGAFTITQSLEDFEGWLNDIKNIIEELEKESE